MVRRYALPAAFFGFLVPGACSVHSMRVCHLILEHRAVSPAELAQARVQHSLAGLLDLAQQPGLMDAFLPEVLALLASLLEFDRLAIRDSVPGASPATQGNSPGSDELRRMPGVRLAPACAQVLAARLLWQATPQRS